MKIQCCYGCKKRHLGCHTDCPEYLEESKNLREMAKKRRAEHQTDVDVNSLHIEMQLKMQRKRPKER